MKPEGLGQEERKDLAGEPGQKKPTGQVLMLYCGQK